MGDKSKIQWTDATWNTVYGCTRASSGCDQCYAVRQTQRLAGTQEAARGRVNEGKAHFNGTIALLPDRLEIPLRWKRPRRIFVNSLSDLFHPDVPFDYIDRIFAVMALTSQHTYQVLTKRPERMREYMARQEPLWSGGYAVDRDWAVARAAEEIAGSEVPLWDWPLPNVWLGTSIEDQATADERIPELLQTPAAVRFVSYEPALGPVAFRQSWKDYLAGWDTEATMDRHGDPEPMQVQTERLDWVIVGGESGPRARPCDVGWIRDTVRQCRDAAVACFVKQLGAAPYEFCPPERGGVTDTNTETELRAIFGQEGADRMREQQRLSPGPGWCFTVTPEGNGTGWYRSLRLQDPKGGDPDEWPRDLRVREYPR